MIFAAVFIIAACFALGALLGAPYLPIFDRDAAAAMELAGVGEGTSVLDLGSGDGRILRAAARRGATAAGFEVNPIMFLISLILCWRWRRQLKVRLGNYWTANWPPADVISVFSTQRAMAKLQHELEQRLKAPTTVVSYVFEFSGHRPVRRNRNIFVYRIKPLANRTRPGRASSTVNP